MRLPRRSTRVHPTISQTAGRQEADTSDPVGNITSSRRKTPWLKKSGHELPVSQSAQARPKLVVGACADGVLRVAGCSIGESPAERGDAQQPAGRLRRPAEQADGPDCGEREGHDSEGERLGETRHQRGSGRNGQRRQGQRRQDQAELQDDREPEHDHQAGLGSPYRRGCDLAGHGRSLHRRIVAARRPENVTVASRYEVRTCRSTVASWAPAYRSDSSGLSVWTWPVRPLPSTLARRRRSSPISR